MPDWLKDWQGNGIIARVQSQTTASAVLATRLPVVDVLGLVPDAGIPLVHVDDQGISRQAAEHLLERGFQHFGYFGIAQENWSVRRREYFAEWLRGAGYRVEAYELPRSESGRISWEQRENDLAAWITRLPKPAGVMVCSDQRALDFLEACRRAGVEVPDDVAVIGVDNDEVLCEIGFPPLSSVWPAHNQAGYEAAALLDKLMKGGARPAHPILVAPGGVVTRVSTDVLAIDDRHLSKALRVIREHSGVELTNDQVASCAGLSRSILQRRFREKLGRSIHDEILRVRLKRACQLLRETELPLIEVAERAGFKHQEYLGAVFKLRLGKTPAQYRREAGQLGRSGDGRG